MTPFKSTVRLILYVLITMLTTFTAGFESINTSDTKQVVIFSVSILIAGLVVARSYLDQSESLIPKP